MNITAIIAVLELKGIISREEGERIVEFFNNRPQSTLLDDAVNQVKEFVNEAEDVTKKVVTTAKTEAKKVAEKVKEDVQSEIDAAVALAAEADGSKQTAESDKK